MFKTVVGHGNNPNSLSAVEEVLQQCVSSLRGVYQLFKLILVKINVQCRIR